MSSSSKTTSRRHALGLSLAVATSLPCRCGGALSISSGYEEFLTDIRRRIICEESDVFDEAVERGRARPCDSLEDGPFCRGLPKMPRAARHRPFTVDSIVPQHLFGNEPASSSSSSGEVPGSAQDGTPRTSPSAFATQTLNQYLEEHYSPKESSARTVVPAVEGRLAWDQLPLRNGFAASSRGLPPSFSHGLPAGVVATFTGAWQEEVVVPVRVVPGQRQGVAARLNGALGSILFSRPVVLRHFVVRPPLGVSSGRHRLQVRARKAGQEAWRQEYDFDAQGKRLMRPICGPGDLVAARHQTGRYFLAVILAADAHTATIRWLDQEHFYTHQPWRHLRTTAGEQCDDGAGGRGMRDVDFTGNGLGSSGPWRDLARRLKAVDEISLCVPDGQEGWLISEVVVASPRWQPRHASGSGVDDAREQDPTSLFVQVRPGLLTVLVEASQAAVLYDADDMLERGLQVRSGSEQALDSGNDVDAAVDAGDGEKDAPDNDSNGEAVSKEDETIQASTDFSPRLRTGLRHCVEGFQQFLRGLARPVPEGVPTAKLPSHVSLRSVLNDAEKLVTQMEAPDAAQVKKFAHFEKYFSFQWDYQLNVDALRVAYERWKRDPATKVFGQNVLVKGQVWSGIYHCTQGPSTISLKLTKVSRSTGLVRQQAATSAAGFPIHAGADLVQGEVTFWVDMGAEAEKLKGQYEVSGHFDPETRALVLDPVIDSWQEKPMNVVMVGLHGIVTRRGMADRSHRFAGFVPTVGCDSFEMKAPDTKAPGTPAGTSKEARRADEEAQSAEARDVPSAQALDTGDAWKTPSENTMHARLSRALDAARERWRDQLEYMIDERGTESIGTAAAAQEINPQAVEKLLRAARKGEVMNLQMETIQGAGADGADMIVVKIGDTEVRVGR